MIYNEALEAIRALPSDQMHALGLVCINRAGEAALNHRDALEAILSAGLVFPAKLSDGELTVGYDIPVHMAWCQVCSEQQARSAA